MNEKDKLLEQIQIADFVIIETALFLDGHPSDKKALEHYNKYRRIKKDAVTEYESKYGPLTIYGNEFDCWKWVDEPWPWEMGVN